MSKNSEYINPNLQKQEGLMIIIFCTPLHLMKFGLRETFKKILTILEVFHFKPKNIFISPFVIHKGNSQGTAMSWINQEVKSLRILTYSDKNVKLVKSTQISA